MLTETVVVSHSEYSESYGQGLVVGHELVQQIVDDENGNQSVKQVPQLLIAWTNKPVPFPSYHAPSEVVFLSLLNDVRSDFINPQELFNFLANYSEENEWDIESYNGLIEDIKTDFNLSGEYELQDEDEDEEENEEENEEEIEEVNVISNEEVNEKGTIQI